tara:strand:- start:420 stop:575 length:156 start_codon:yes stop_codon:yes gene_type:complete
MKFANIPIETAKRLIQSFSFESQLVKNWSVEQTRNIQAALEQIEFPVEEEA